MNKEEYGDTVIYTDDVAGITYIYDGIRGLLPIKYRQDGKDEKGKNKRGIGLPDNFDEEELKRQDAEREEQIKREREEAEKNGDIELEDEDDLYDTKDLGDLFTDQSAIDELIGEAERVVRKEKSVRNAERRAAEKAANRYKASNHGIDEFKHDIKKLISKEVAPLIKKSWSKMNKKYEGSGVEKPGKLSKKNPRIPRLRIYYDQSGSWGAGDIAVGNKAISELNYYVKKKLLVIEVRYFANTLHSTPRGEGWNEGGTGAGELLMRDIARDRPENVVVMTDNDFDYYGNVKNVGQVTVDGGVFLLFRNGSASKDLIDCLHGKKMTKIYAF